MEARTINSIWQKTTNLSVFGPEPFICWSTLPVFVAYKGFVKYFDYRLKNLNAVSNHMWARFQSMGASTYMSASHYALNVNVDMLPWQCQLTAVYVSRWQDAVLTCVPTVTSGNAERVNEWQEKPLSRDAGRLQPGGHRQVTGNLVREKYMTEPSYI